MEDLKKKKCFGLNEPIQSNQRWETSLSLPSREQLQEEGEGLANEEEEENAMRMLLRELPLEEGRSGHQCLTLLRRWAR